MQVIAFNGSPRKGWNTATLLEAVLAGAASQGAEVEMVHLYDLQYQGCASCFACKTRAHPPERGCTRRDGLTELLGRAARADALVLGSPIYLGTVTGEMKSFFERLVFPYLAYDGSYSSLFPRRIRTAFVYTMNLGEAAMVERGYPIHLDSNARYLGRMFGSCETLCSTDTCQFEDYGRMAADGFDAAHKQRRRAEQFPKDRAAAFALGVRLAAPAGEG